MITLRYVVLILCLFFSANSFSATATAITDSSGELIGVNGLFVGGIEYDVSFIDGTFMDIFSNGTDLVFHDASEAESASNALLNWFLAPAGLLYRYDPEKITGIESNIAIIETPYFYGEVLWGWGYLQEMYLSSLATINAQGYPPVLSTQESGGDPYFDDHFASDTVYAKWQVAAVPIPSTAWLFGSALLGLIGVTRRKKA